MIRQTSLEAYQKLLPTLPLRQRQVYAVYYCFYPETLTNMEASERLGWSINRVTPRTLELRNKGLLVIDEVRPCRVTGAPAMAQRCT